jgi:hypothetical protein
MAMNRILEFSPSPEEAVVSRILVLVHQTVDECFPAVAQQNRQFTKTLFSDGERTAIGNPSDAASGAAFALEEDTASDNKVPAEAQSADGQPQSAPPTPSRPPVIPPPPRPAAVTMKEPPYSKAGANQAPQAHDKHAVSGHVPTQPTPKTRIESRQGTALDESMAGLEGQRPDWVSRILLAALIAGIVVFIYTMYGA